MKMIFCPSNCSLWWEQKVKFSSWMKSERIPQDFQSRVMVLGFKTSPQKQEPGKMTKRCPVPNTRIPKVQSQWRPALLRKPFLPILESLPPGQDQTHLLPCPHSHVFLLCSSSSTVGPLLGGSRSSLTSFTLVVYVHKFHFGGFYQELSVIQRHPPLIRMSNKKK